MKLRTKLMLLIILATGLTLGIITVLMYRNMEITVKKQALSSFEENVQKTGAILDSKLEVIKEATEKLNLESELYHIFKEIDPDNELELLKANQEISSILRDNFPWFSNIYSAHLVTSYYRFGEADKNYYPDFYKSRIAKETCAADGHIVWFPTYSYTNMYGITKLEDEQIPYGKMFSVARRMNLSDVSSGKVSRLGDEKENPILIVNFTPDYLQKILVKSGSTNDSLEDMDYFVVSNDGDVVYSTDERYQAGMPYQTEWLKELSPESKYGGLQEQEDEEEFLISYSRSEITDWLVIMKIPVSSLIGSLRNQYVRYLIAACSVLMVVAVIFAWFTSAYINRYFYRVIGVIERIGEGDFEQSVAYDKKDEFAFFYEKLNQMNSDIRRLIHENYEVKLMQRETEIRALNAQLNPHFIYNTLNVINWTCLDGNMEDTSRMLVNLSRMLQYTTYHRGMYELLQDDMEWLRRYLYILQVRYENKFEVLIDIPQELMGMKVPKLFLQPFVENAIVHGFAKQQEKGVLEIHTEHDEKTVIFYVEDNGCGMSQEKIGQVMSVQKDAIGIANVHKRIQILYGEAYGVEIHSQPGEGTSVMVKVGYA